MRRKKGIWAVFMVVCLLALSPAVIAAEVATERLAGIDRVSTALQVAGSGWTYSDTVILASADQAHLVDSLAAAPLAGQENAPILLTSKDNLTSSVREQIRSLGATKVFVIGAVSQNVINHVRSISNDLALEVLSGPDRWATAEAVNAKLTNVKGTFVVGYNAVADALSVGSYAAARGYQIVLTDTKGNVSAQKLKGTVYLVGGSGVVNNVSGATRLGGADRYETNIQIMRGLDFQYGCVYVANGASMVDALSVSSLAGRDCAPVLLTDGGKVPALNDAKIQERMAETAKIVALGGSVAVPDTALKGSGNSSTGSTAKQDQVPASIKSVQAVADKIDAQKADQSLQIKVNKTATVTAAQLKSAGYSVEFQATEMVFGDDNLSSTGKLNQKDLQSLYAGGSGIREFEYMVTIYKKNELIAESDFETVTIFDNRYDATGSIRSYQLNLIGSGGSVDILNATSHTLLVGESLEITRVMAPTNNSSQAVDVSAGVTLRSSNTKVVTVDDGWEKRIYAEGAGTANVTIKSGTQTKSIRLTVKDDTEENRRIAKTITLDKSRIKITKSGADFLKVKIKDQYGDPYVDNAGVYVGSSQYEFGKNGGPLGQIAVIDFVAEQGLSVEGEALLRISGAGEGSEDLVLYGETAQGGGQYKELKKVSVVVEADADAAKYALVLPGSGSSKVEMDRNALEGKRELRFYLMGYTSSGACTGEYKLSSEDVQSTNEKLFTVEAGSSEINVVLAERDSKGKLISQVGTAQVRAKSPKGTVSQSVKVVNTAPELTQASFKKVSELEMSSLISLDDLLDLQAVIASGSVGDGRLYIRSSAEDQEKRAELYYFVNLSDSERVQVVGYLESNKSAVRFLGDSRNGDFCIDTSGSGLKNTTVQFKVVKLNGSVLDKVSVKIVP